MSARSGRAAGLTALFLLGWILRVLVALEYEAHHPLAQRPVIDERSYERWALAIAGGDVVGQGVFFQEPLYPYALAAVYRAAGPPLSAEVASPRQRTAARHAQAFLGALCVLGVFLLAERLFGATAALVAGLAAATYRPLLLFPSLLLKPNLFLPLLLALALVLVGLPLAPPERGRARWLGRWLLAGALGGLCALLRGNALVLLPCLVAWPLVHALRRAERLALAAALAAALGIALVLLPVALRNLHAGGVFVLTTSGAGTNVYGGNNPLNPWGRATELPWVRGVPEHEAEDWRREAERRTGTPQDLASSSRFWLAEAGRVARADPAAAAARLGRKLLLTLGPYEVPDNHSLAWDARWVALLRAPFPGWLPWGWLGLAGLFACVRGAGAPEARRRRARLAVLALLYLATIVLTVTSMRVRLGLAVLLLPFAGGLVASLAAALARGARRAEGPSLARLGAALALAAPLAWIPHVTAAERAQDLDERDFNLAVYELEAGRRDAARALAERLAGAHPGTPRVETLLAELDTRDAIALRVSGAGDAREREALLDAALARLRRVVAAPGVGARETFRARAVAGLAQLEAGSGARAEGHLRAALAFDPSDRGARFALANALWMRAGEAGVGEEERRAWMREARDLLEGLERERHEEDLARRLEEVRAALGP